MPVALQVWNVMFNWRIRHKGIADLIRQSGVDVIGLQEVRAGSNFSQLDELRALLPEFGFSAYATPPTEHAETGSSSGGGGGVSEGVAILSRYPLSDVRELHMPAVEGSADTNSRVALYARVGTAAKAGAGPGGDVGLVVTHVSWDRHGVQCMNFEQLRRFAALFPPPL